MSSFFVMIASLWIVFWEFKTELFWFLFQTEGTVDVVYSIAGDFWESEDELRGALSDEIENWD